MFTRIDDFAAEWTREAELTVGVMEALTDASLAQANDIFRDIMKGDVEWYVQGG